MQNTKQHPFPIHAGSVYTLCVLLLCFLLQLLSGGLQAWPGLGFTMRVQSTRPA